MEYFKFDNNYNHNDSIKIQLRINNNITDISNMFNFCEELLSISDLSVDNFNITEKISHLMEIILIILVKQLIIRMKLI